MRVIAVLDMYGFIKTMNLGASTAPARTHIRVAKPCPIRLHDEEELDSKGPQTMEVLIFEYVFSEQTEVPRGTRIDHYQILEQEQEKPS